MLRVVILVELVLATMALVALTLADGMSAGRSPETSIRRYVLAVAGRNLEGALQELAPESRERYRGFIEGQLGSHYRIVGMAVRVPSLLSRFAKAETVTSEQTVATVFLEITPLADSGEAPWSATYRVEMRNESGRWYMALPLLWGFGGGVVSGE